MVLIGRYFLNCPYLFCGQSVSLTAAEWRAATSITAHVLHTERCCSIIWVIESSDNRAFLSQSHGTIPLKVWIHWSLHCHLFTSVSSPPVSVPSLFLPSNRTCHSNLISNCKWFLFTSICTDSSSSSLLTSSFRCGFDLESVCITGKYPSKCKWLQVGAAVWEWAVHPMSREPPRANQINPARVLPGSHKANGWVSDDITVIPFPGGGWHGYQLKRF